MYFFVDIVILTRLSIYFPREEIGKRFHVANFAHVLSIQDKSYIFKCFREIFVAYLQVGHDMSNSTYLLSNA